MLKNWEKHIPNAFDCSYSNDYTEGCNNSIKVIKRTALGYRNFHYFRRRRFGGIDKLRLHRRDAFSVAAKSRHDTSVPHARLQGLFAAETDYRAIHGVYYHYKPFRN
ncbi:MAG: transposase [Clostridia bacterium]|nr:transposase [Clostridia bacterium]